MSALTKAQAITQRDQWLAASTAVAQGQEYEIGNRRLTRADAAHIANQLEHWERVVSQFLAIDAGATTNHGFRVASFGGA